MALPNDLVSQFVKATHDDKKEKTESTIYGTVVEYDGKKYVRFDGSELLTPVSSTTNLSADERVTVMIKNHMATVTGNISSPAARGAEVDSMGEKIAEFDTVIANKVSTETLEAKVADIEDLIAGKISVDDLEANTATIKELIANKATIQALDAEKARIDTLETDKLSATDADIRYANINFANIGEAALEKIYADSGLIEEVDIREGRITGKLVGVTIVGDLIKGNTVVADKLVIKGENGLFYKLNTDGEKVTSTQTDENSLHGSIITAKTITADRISVSDLVAFDATIGGFNITDSSLHSGVKDSINNTTQGVYLDKTGQIAFGDGTNFVKYYKVSDGVYKLAISADSFTYSGKSFESAVSDSITLGGTNLLPDTNVNTLSAVAGKESRYWSDSSLADYVTCEFIELTDPPIASLKYGIRQVSTGGHTNGRNLTWRSTECIEMEDGADYTLSCYARVTLGEQARIRMRFYIPGDDGSHYRYVNLNNTVWKHVSVTIKVDKSKWLDNDYCYIGFGLLATHAATVELCGFKLEKGNKATEWSPSPSDVKTETTSLIEQSADSILLRVSDAYATKDSVASSIELTANEIKSEVSGTYATNESVSSSIEQTANEIRSEVSGTYATKTSVTTISQKANEISLTVSNIAVGGTQILRNTNSTTELISGGSWTHGYWRSASSGTGARTAIDITDAPNPVIVKGWALGKDGESTGHNDISQSNISIHVGETYTVSCYARGSGKLKFQYGTSPYTSNTPYITLSNETTWKRYSMTFTIGTEEGQSSNGKTHIYFGNCGTGLLEICGMKLEVGTKPTDWCPAPEELDAGSISVRKDLIKVSTGGKFEVTSGQIDLDADDTFRLSVGDSENPIIDIAGEKNGSIRVNRLYANNQRPYFEEVTWNSTDNGDINWLRDILQRNMYGKVTYTLNESDPSITPIRFRHVFVGKLKIIGKDNTIKCPPLRFDELTGNVFLENLIFDVPGKNAIDSYGGKIVLSSCWIRSANYGLVAREGAEIRWNCNKTLQETFTSGGYCTNYFAYATYASQITYGGLIPRSGKGRSSAAGNSLITDVTIDSSTNNLATVWKDTSAATTVTTTDTTITGSLKYYSTSDGWVTGNGAYQGYTTGKKKCYGYVYFALPTCTTINKATLTLHRKSGVGKGAPVDVHIYGSTITWSNSTGSTKPALSTAEGEPLIEKEDAVIAGESITLNVLTQIRAIKSGTIRYLVLFQHDDTKTMNNKVYSSDYCCWDSASLFLTYTV